VTGLDRDTLAERAAAVERHLDRVAARLPPSPDELRRGTDVDLARGQAIARTGPADLRAFLVALRDRI